MTQVHRQPSGKRARALLLAALVPAAGLAGTADYGVLPVSVQAVANRLEVQGSLATPASRAVAWAVLTDPARFPDFVPGLQACRVLEEHGPVKVVAQRGEITAGPRLRYDGTLRVEEQAGQGVHMRFLSGPFRDSEGEWRLTGEAPVTLTYRLSIDLVKTPLPPPMASAVAEQQVRIWLTALVGEMARRQKGPR